MPGERWRRALELELWREERREERRSASEADSRLGGRGEYVGEGGKLGMGAAGAMGGTGGGSIMSWGAGW